MSIIKYDFTEPTDYTYDDTVLQVDNGASLKDLITSEMTFVSNFNLSVNAMYSSGSPTATIVGGATIIDGGKWGKCLDLAHNDLRYVTYEFTDNIDLTQGCISLWYNPNYTGKPTFSEVCFDICKFNSVNNRVVVYHSHVDSYLYYRIYDSSGVLIGEYGAEWSPTAGTWYYIEFNYDFNNNIFNLSIDGIIIANSTDVVTRTATPTLMMFGTNYGGSTISNFLLDEIIIYNVVKHTADFIPPTSPVFCYCLNNPTLKLATNLSVKQLDEILVTITKTGLDDIKFNFMSGTTEYYYDPTLLYFAEGTGYDNAISETDFESKASDFIDFIGGIVSFSFVAYFHSYNGTSTPTLNEITIEYSLGEYCTLHDVRKYLTGDNAVDTTDEKVNEMKMLADDTIVMDLLVVFGKTQLDAWYTGITPESIRDLSVYKTLEYCFLYEYPNMSVNETPNADIEKWQTRYNELLKKVKNGLIAVLNPSDSIQKNIVWRASITQRTGSINSIEDGTSE